MVVLSTVKERAPLSALWPCDELIYGAHVLRICDVVNMSVDILVFHIRTDKLDRMRCDDTYKAVDRLLCADKDTSARVAANNCAGCHQYVLQVVAHKSFRKVRSVA